MQLSRARAKVEEYLTHEKTVFATCTSDDVRFAMGLMRNYHEYNHLVILSVANRLSIPLFSFDEPFKRVAAKNSVRLFDTPKASSMTSTRGRGD